MNKFVTILRGGRQSGKTTELVRLISDRVNTGDDCWVFCVNINQRKLLIDQVNKSTLMSPEVKNLRLGRLEYPNGVQVRFSIARHNWEMNLRGVDTTQYHLFLNDCDYTTEGKFILEFFVGWASRTATSCTLAHDEILC